jgi:hypothetical protein
MSGPARHHKQAGGHIGQGRDAGQPADAPSVCCLIQHPYIYAQTTGEFKRFMRGVQKTSVFKSPVTNSNPTGGGLISKGEKPTI